jgi:site-specific DNA-cytosine methylase
MARNRDERITFRFSSEEKNLLKEKAATARMNMNEYMLALAKDKKIIVIENVPNLVLEITRIGVNINQVAAVANSKKTVNQHQVENLCMSLNEVKKILKTILREIYGNGDS